jgi:hypothetical protein
MRLSAAFSALWLLLVLVQPPMLHTCEVHSAHSAAGHSMASMDDMTSMHGDMQSSHDHAPKHCTCIGDCCGVIPSALPAQRVVATIAARVLAPTSARSEHEYVAAWVDFVLPFSTGPPAIV